MATPIWPLSLQQEPNFEGFSEQLPDNKITSTMESANTKTRLRFTSAPTVYTVSFRVDMDQRTTLRTFYEETTLFGSRSFQWVNPLDQTARNYLFQSPPRFVPRGTTAFDASFTIQQLVQ